MAAPYEAYEAKDANNSINRKSPGSSLMHMLIHGFMDPCQENYLINDCTDAALFGNLPLQQFPHLRGGPEFPIPPRMVRIINASNTRLQAAHMMHWFPAAAPE
jgi:hypothetical protein